MMISRELEVTLGLALREAVRRHHEGDIGVFEIARFAEHLQQECAARRDRPLTS